jgi:hypothetical protein
MIAGIDYDTEGRRTYIQATIHGKLVHASDGEQLPWEVRQHAEMLGCHASALIWHVLGRPFWRHKRGTSCNGRCDTITFPSGESERHELFKNTLASLWRKERYWTSPPADTVTITIPNGYRSTRRPDTLSIPTTKPHDPRKMRHGDVPFRVPTVHETQASSAPLEEFHQRWSDYRRAGYATVAYVLPGVTMDLPRTMHVLRVDEEARLTGVLTRIDEIDPEFIDPTDVDKAVHLMARGQWLRTDHGLVTKAAHQAYIDEGNTTVRRMLRDTPRSNGAARVCDVVHVDQRTPSPVAVSLPMDTTRPGQTTPHRTPADTRPHPRKWRSYILDPNCPSKHVDRIARPEVGGIICIDCEGWWADIVDLRARMAPYLERSRNPAQGEN